MIKKIHSTVILIILLILFVIVFSLVLELGNEVWKQRGKTLRFRVWEGVWLGAEKREMQEGDWVKLKFVVWDPPYQTGSDITIRFEDVVVIVEGSPEVILGQTVEVVGRITRVDARGKKVLYVLKYPYKFEVEEAVGLVDSVWGSLRQESGEWGDKFSRIVELGLPEPHGSLAVGILLGIKRRMNSEFYDSLISTGTIHVIAASGYNITVVARVMLLTAGYFVSKRKAAILALVGVWSYVLLAGASAAVVRAGFMGSLVFGAAWFGRDYIAGWSLVLSGMVMLIVNPKWWGDVGFWLSVAATAGILWFEKDINLKLNRWLAKVRGGAIETEETNERVGDDKENNSKGLMEVLWGVRKSLLGDLSTTLAATITTTPIIIAVFGRVSVASPLVNTLVLWLVAPIMLVSSIKLVAGLMWLPLTQTVNWVLYVLLKWFVVVVTWFGRMDSLGIEIKDGLIDKYRLVVWLLIGLYFGVVVWIKKKRREKI